MVQLLVKKVTQFPSEPECDRVIKGLTDADLLARMNQCKSYIKESKDKKEREALAQANMLIREMDADKVKFAFKIFRN